MGSEVVVEGPVVAEAPVVAAASVVVVLLAVVGLAASLPTVAAVGAAVVAEASAERADADLYHEAWSSRRCAAKSQ